MKNKRKYVVSLFNSSNECVLSRVVSSRSAAEALVSFVLTVSVSSGRDSYLRFDDGEFSVSCSPFVD